MNHDRQRHREPETYTLEKAAKILGISLSAAYKAAHRGQIPTIRLGKRIFVPRRALERLLEGQNNSAA